MQKADHHGPPFCVWGNDCLMSASSPEFINSPMPRISANGVVAGGFLERKIDDRAYLHGGYLMGNFVPQIISKTLHSVFHRLVLFILRRPFLTLLFVCFVACAVLYRAYHPSVSWRQELELTIATPNGVVTAASVVKIKVWRTPIIIGAGGQFSSIEGEALAIDLGDGKFVFALLDGQDFLFKAAFKTAGREYLWMIRDIRLIKNQETPLAVDFDDLPTLVTFIDINDPDSITLVEPHDLASSFGEGFSLLGANLKFSRKAITQGRLEQIWPCLVSVDRCIPWARSSPLTHPLHGILGARIRSKHK